ncbi:MAG: hypothetical protein Q7R81_04665 [Candidatus Peregrinibacteria bacterium]|nr:hypothetical protein [Candidatus Peregrinibacteria bacterium]
MSDQPQQWFFLGETSATCVDAAISSALLAPLWFYSCLWIAYFLRKARTPKGKRETGEKSQGVAPASKRSTVLKVLALIGLLFLLLPAWVQMIFWFPQPLVWVLIIFTVGYGAYRLMASIKHPWFKYVTRGFLALYLLANIVMIGVGTVCRQCEIPVDHRGGRKLIDAVGPQGLAYEYPVLWLLVMANYSGYFIADLLSPCPKSPSAELTRYPNTPRFEFCPWP